MFSGRPSRLPTEVAPTVVLSVELGPGDPLRAHAGSPSWLIEMLVEKGHAYAAEDGSGDVYFDVRSWPAYGELSGQRIDEMEAARHPFGHGRTLDLDTLTRVDLALAIQRQVVGVLGDEHVGK